MSFSSGNARFEAWFREVTSEPYREMAALLEAAAGLRAGQPQALSELVDRVKHLMSVAWCYGSASYDLAGMVRRYEGLERELANRRAIHNAATRALRDLVRSLPEDRGQWETWTVRCLGPLVWAIDAQLQDQEAQAGRVAERPDECPPL